MYYRNFKIVNAIDRTMGRKSRSQPSGKSPRSSSSYIGDKRLIPRIKEVKNWSLLLLQTRDILDNNDYNRAYVSLICQCNREPAVYKGERWSHAGSRRACHSTAGGVQVLGDAMMFVY